MNRKPILTILSMILILAFVLTGCSQPDAAPAPTAAPAATDRSRPLRPNRPRRPAAPRPPQPRLRPSRPRPPNPPRFPQPASKYNEAPMLADLVKAGTLPAVDERLPKTPYVIDGP